MSFVIFIKSSVFATLFFLVPTIVNANGYIQKEPYVAPPYVPPPPLPSRLNLIDNDDGTITETKSKLMWTKKDSFADLGKC